MKATERSFSPSLRCAGVLGVLLLGGLACLAQAPVAPPAGAAANKPIVGDVLIQGSRFITAQQIKSQLKTRVGAPFDEETAREDARTIMGTHQFANVEVLPAPQTDGRVFVYFLVKDFDTAVKKVIYEGAKHLKDDDLNVVSGVRAGAPLNPGYAKMACDLIVKKYNDEGRPFAECHLVKGDKAGDEEVVFSITEGPKVWVKSISFVGNTFVSEGRLKEQITSVAVWVGLTSRGAYVPAMVEGDVAKLEQYYANFGFLDARVSCERQWVSDGTGVNLIFHVQEGQRYMLQDVPQITGRTSVPAEQLQPIIKVQANSFVNQGDMEIDKKNLTTYIGYTGHQTTVSYNPSWVAPGLAHVCYDIEERPAATVGTITIVGNTRTQDHVIYRAIPLYPGQPLTYPDLDVAARNLARLGIFQVTPDGSIKPEVKVLENPNDPNSPVRDLLVNVHEDNTGSLMFGVGVNSDSGLTGSIVLNERNFNLFRPPTSIDDLFSGDAFRGAGQELRIEAVPGTELQRYSVSLREPSLFDSPYSGTVGGYFYQRQYNEDEETRTGFKASVGRKLGDYWSANIGVRVEDIEINNIAAGAPPDYTNVQGYNFLTGAKVGVTRDSRDSFLRPTEGSLFNVSYEECFGTYVFPLVNLSASKYFTVWERPDKSGKQVLTFRTQVGFAGDNTPVYERFYGGGYSSIRGFAFRGVGPDSGDGFKTGGDFQFLNSVEYDVPLLASDKLRMVYFIDSGTIEERPEIRDYRVSAGFGFRIQIPMMGQVPIALDFGFPIVKGPYDNSQVFSFFIGAAF